MKILLTNDDGYAAPGIQALLARLQGRHQVSLCAPLSQKSAASHSISLFKPMELREVENGHAIDGTPADCVKAAICGLHNGDKFDLLLSGINDGANLGDDIFYSGTVAGAREGSLNGMFSIACSLAGWNTAKDFGPAADFVANLLDQLPASLLREELILNVNFPETAPYRGVKITTVGKRVYKDLVTVDESDGKKFITISGDLPDHTHLDGSDLECVDQGYVSITPLTNVHAPSPLVAELRGLLEKGL